MAYSNSPLVTYTVKSPNHSGKRTHKIDRITPHCFVGQVTAQRGGEVFLPESKEASCNYVIGKDGDVCLVVDEANRSWCSSSSANDQRAITIECASDTDHPYAMNDAVYNKLVELCADICKRNGIKKLLWLGDKTTSLAYSPKSGEAILTAHRWFANKACPGDWLYNRYTQLAEAVNKKLGSSGTTVDKPVATPTTPSQSLKFKVGDTVKFTGCLHYTSSYAGATAKGCKAGLAKVTNISAGKPHPYHLQAVAGKGSTVYGWVNEADVTANTSSTSTPAKKSIEEIAKEVIRGNWGNGQERKNRLTAAGYNYSEVQKKVNQMLK